MYYCPIENIYYNADDRHRHSCKHCDQHYEAVDPRIVDLFLTADQKLCNYRYGKSAHEKEKKKNENRYFVPDDTRVDDVTLKKSPSGSNEKEK